MLDDYKNSFDEFREVRKQLKTAIDLETQMSSRIEISDRSLGYQGAIYLVPNVSITDTIR